MKIEELTCKELVELVTEYLEGTLPQPERMRFDEHLASCPSCRSYLEQMRQTIRIVGVLTEEALSPEVKQELLTVFREWKRT